MFQHQLFQPILQNVRIDLGRGHIGVAEKRLDGSKVGASCQQVRRKCVAQGVGGDLFGAYTSFNRQSFDKVVEPYARQVPQLATRWEQKP